MLVRPPGPIATLPAALPRPAGLVEGTWTAARLDGGDLGPSLLEVVMWFPKAALGGAGPASTVTIDAEAVRALLPSRDLPVDQGVVRVTGPTQPAALFEGSGYFGARAVELDGGLLVAVRVGG